MESYVDIAMEMIFGKKKEKIPNSYLPALKKMLRQLHSKYGDDVPEYKDTDRYLDVVARLVPDDYIQVAGLLVNKDRETELFPGRSGKSIICIREIDSEGNLIATRLLNHEDKGTTGVFINYAPNPHKSNSKK